MARPNRPNSAAGNFFITIGATPNMDARGAYIGYAAFGHVVSGMDVVRKIWDQPVDPEAGEGFMKGQMLAQPVKVISVRRVVAP